MPTTLKASSRAYSVLVTLYPVDLRRRFGEEMLDVFEQQLECAWAERGIRGMLLIWLCAIGELLFVALPAQLAQPIFIVPVLSLFSNSVMFLALLRQLSPLAELGRFIRH